MSSSSPERSSPPLREGPQVAVAVPVPVGRSVAVAMVLEGRFRRPES